VQVRARLYPLSAELRSISGVKRLGVYMFTLDWSHENKTMLDTNFSETYEHKCGHVFKMDNGNYFIYPNNRIVWIDKAYTFNRINNNPGYKIDTNLYTVDSSRGYSTDSSYITDFNTETKL
jgi:hypothetical protein